jgi:3-oxoacyl-[acyl-carrier protein] reductase
MSDQQWTTMLDVHLTAPFRLLRAAAPVLREAAQRDREEGREPSRRVVNVSSVAGVYGAAGMTNYAAAKAGVVGFTKALAKEWGPYGVNVNAVAFGIIRTRLTVGAAAETTEVGGAQVPLSVDVESHFDAERDVPVGRFGSVEDAAGAIYLFCAPESSYVTGETLVCGGGFTT